MSWRHALLRSTIASLADGPAAVIGPAKRHRVFTTCTHNEVQLPAEERAPAGADQDLGPRAEAGTPAPSRAHAAAHRVHDGGHHGIVRAAGWRCFRTDVRGEAMIAAPRPHIYQRVQRVGPNARIVGQLRGAEGRECIDQPGGVGARKPTPSPASPLPPGCAGAKVPDRASGKPAVARRASRASSSRFRERLRQRRLDSGVHPHRPWRRLAAHRSRSARRANRRDRPRTGGQPRRGGMGGHQLGRPRPLGGDRDSALDGGVGTMAERRW